MKRATHFGNYKVPKSRYQIDNDRVVNHHKNRLALLIENGKPTFRIFAPKAHMMRDGDLIELIDGVTMRALDDSGSSHHR